MDISTSSTSPSMMAAAPKIRRLGVQEDVHYANNGGHEVERRNLVVDTTNTGLASSNSCDEVSPTDVLSFPAPPTPTKTRKSKSPFPPTPNPPETPSISRSGRKPPWPRHRWWRCLDCLNGMIVRSSQGYSKGACLFGIGF